MQSIFLILSFLLIGGCASLHQPQTQGTIYWDEPSSEVIFNRSIKKDFFKLSNYFETQSNRLYCGPTTATIVLNALRARKAKEIPIDPNVLMSSEKKFLPKGFNPSYPQYTQRNVFTAVAKKRAKSKAQVLGQPVHGKKDFGFQLRQYADFLKAHDLKVEFYVIDEKADRKTLKQKMIENLGHRDDYVLINYKRSALGEGAGTFSTGSLR